MAIFLSQKEIVKPLLRSVIRQRSVEINLDNLREANFSRIFRKT
jgi:hypothetical protein